MIEKKKQIIKLLGGIYPGIYSFWFNRICTRVAKLIMLSRIVVARQPNIFTSV